MNFAKLVQIREKVLFNVKKENNYLMVDVHNKVVFAHNIFNIVIIVLEKKNVLNVKMDMN